MARPRQPIDLVEAKGKKHLTKKEINDRRDQEPKVECLDVKPPEYLPSNLVNEFNDIAKKLLDIGIMTELDEDCLARYLLSKQNYLHYTKMLNAAIKARKIYDMEKLAALQDKAFKQCRAGASDLGLTISSRCRLVVPKTEEEPKENKFAKFNGGKAASGA